MAIRVLWAEPGPKADEALRRFWARAHEVSVEIIARRAVEQTHAQFEGDEYKRKEPAQ